MKLIFIRHAEPDYANNTLTPKGFEEARLLARRTANWHVTKAYSSPLGRALDTARPSLEAWAQRPVDLADPTVISVHDWLQEFYYPVNPELHPHHKSIVWDLSPEYLRDHPNLFLPDGWRDNELVQSGGLDQIYDDVIRQFDDLLATYGYVRDGACYAHKEGKVPTDAYMVYDGHTKEHMQCGQVEEEETTLVFFCHLGVMMVLMSHLMNTSPFTLWHGFFTPPSSVTIFSAEERLPRHAYFRCQVCGDTSHLRFADEPVSYYGGFAAPFQN